MATPWRQMFLNAVSTWAEVSPTSLKTCAACWVDRWSMGGYIMPRHHLRTQGVARIFLDNVQHMQTSYVTQGLKMAQVSLAYGCDDFGGTMLEENVVSAAGCFNLETVSDIERVIRRAGYKPLQRNSWYGIADERYEGAAARFPATREEAAHHPAAGRGHPHRTRLRRPHR